jgi:sulfite exporter TauE/SafE
MNEHLAGLTLGFAGSLHCAAMCGPLMLAWRRGREAGSAGRGVAAGAAGEVVGTLGAGRAMAWLAGAVLLAAAASHVTHVPSLPGLPLTRVLARLGHASRTQASRRPWLSALLGGALNACLPCGMLYAALTVAAATGTSSAGWRFMLLFGLGTLPALAGTWLAADLLTPHLRNRLKYSAPVALALVGLLLIARGYAGNGAAAATHRLHTPAHAH